MTFSVLDETQFVNNVKLTLGFSRTRGNVADPPFAMLVGAGFSFGVIPTASGMLEELPRWLYRRTHPSQEVDELAVDAHVRNFWHTANELLEDQLVLTQGRPDTTLADQVGRAYDTAMSHGLSTPYLRREFFREIVRASEYSINQAHLYLASLLRTQSEPSWTERGFNRPFCRTVFTTNFDPLLQRSLQLANVLYYMTDRPEALDLSVEHDHEAIHLVYTHGNIHQHRQANTETELQEFAHKQMHTLSKYFPRHGVIVIGYSGWADACMQALRACDAFDHNLYWCDILDPEAAETQLRSEVREFLDQRKDNAFYVQIQGADQLMVNLHESLGLGSLPEIVRNPFAVIRAELEGIRVPEVRLPKPTGWGSTTIGPQSELGLAYEPTIDRLRRAETEWESAGDHVQLIESAEMKIREGNRVEAVSILNRIIDSKSLGRFRAQALGRRVEILEEDGSIEAAAKDLERILEIEDAVPAGKAMARYKLGNYKLEQGDFAGALADYEMSLAEESLDPRIKGCVYNNAGVCKRYLGDMECAIHYFDSVIDNTTSAAEPKARAYTNRGDVRRKQGDFDGALADFFAALQVPDAPADALADAHGNIGWDHYLRGDHEKAIACAEQALQLNPHAAWIRSNLGLSLLMLDRVDQALDEFRQAIRDFDTRQQLEEYLIADLNKLLKEGKHVKTLKKIRQWAGFRR